MVGHRTHPCEFNKYMKMVKFASNFCKSDAALSFLHGSGRHFSTQLCFLRFAPAVCGSPSSLSALGYFLSIACVLSVAASNPM